jgi:hypothetical protein
MNSNDEFYIGWEAKAAPGIGTAVRKAAVFVLTLALLLPVLLAASQRMIGLNVFEWGNRKTFSGVLQTTPYPHLLVPRPGNADGLPQSSIYCLVATWNFGPDRKAVALLDGHSVTLKGTLINPDNRTMIEVQPETVRPTVAGGTIAPPETVDLGRQTMIGEIVDSRCFLGVMNPGQLTPHRACAIRCISGGVPPAFLVRKKDGRAAYLLPVSAQGRPVNKHVLGMVAEPVEITGEVKRQGELPILRADPATYRRVAKS